MRKKTKQEDEVNTKYRAALIMIVIFFGGGFLLIYLITPAGLGGKPVPSFPKEIGRDVVNITGLPDEFSCENIKQMIELDIFPEYKIIWDVHYDNNHTNSASRTLFQGDARSFEVYYIENCLEKK